MFGSEVQPGVEDADQRAMGAAVFDTTPRGGLCSGLLLGRVCLDGKTEGAGKKWAASKIPLLSSKLDGKKNERLVDLGHPRGEKTTRLVGDCGNEKLVPHQGRPFSKGGERPPIPRAFGPRSLRQAQAHLPGPGRRWN